MSSRQFRALIVEDDVHVARAIGRLLGDVARDIAPTGKEARAAIDARTYGAIIIDVHLPDGSGFQLLEWLRKRWQTPVLVLTGEQNVTYANKAQLFGAEIAFKPQISANVRAFLQRAQGRAGGPEAFDDLEQRAVAAGLSPRERQVLRLLAEGDTHSEAGASLGIASATVKTLVRRLLERTGFENAQALLAAWGARSSAVRRREVREEEREKEGAASGSRKRVAAVTKSDLDAAPPRIVRRAARGK